MQIQLRAPQDRELLPSLFAAIRDALARAGISRELAHDVLLVSEEVRFWPIADIRTGRPAAGLPA